MNETVSEPVTGRCEHCGQTRPLFRFIHGLTHRTAWLCTRDWSNAELNREQAVAA